jgi:putative transposase
MEVAMSYSVDLRKRVLAYIESGHSKYEASAVFGVGRATIYRWLSSDSLTRKPRQTRQRVINKAALKAHVRMHPDVLLRERAQEFSVTPSGLWRAMRAQGLRKKNDAVRGKSFR